MLDAMLGSVISKLLQLALTLPCFLGLKVGIYVKQRTSCMIEQSELRSLIPVKS